MDQSRSKLSLKAAEWGRNAGGGAEAAPSLG